MLTKPNTHIITTCSDIKNVALCTHDTKHKRFEYNPVLERLWLRGDMVIKRAYCDWRQTSFPTYPIVRQTVATTLGFGESEINKLLNSKL